MEMESPEPKKRAVLDLKKRPAEAVFGAWKNGFLETNPAYRQAGCNEQLDELLKNVNHIRNRRSFKCFFYA